MPGLSLYSPVGIPRQAGLLLDGDNLDADHRTRSGLRAGARAGRISATSVASTGCARIAAPGYQAGSGLDVLLALASGAAEVTAVEENAQIIEIIRDRIWSSTGDLYADERVSLMNEAGRVYARRTTAERIDLVSYYLERPTPPGPIRCIQLDRRLFDHNRGYGGLLTVV